MPTLLRSQSISCNPLWLRNRRKELKTFKGKARKDAYLLARKFRNTRDQMALMQVWGVGRPGCGGAGGGAEGHSGMGGGGGRLFGPMALMQAWEGA